MNRKNYKAIFFGTPEFSLPALEFLATNPEIDLVSVFTQPDKPVGKKQILTPPPAKNKAKELKIQVFQPDKIRTEKSLKLIQSNQPDFILLVAYGKIIPPELLKIPKYGWLNIHASLLPKYRGASPIQEAILNGDKTSGLTLMKLDSGLDTGPIISQIEIPISPNDNFQSLHDKLSGQSKKILSNSLIKYLKGEIIPRQQPIESPTPLTKPLSKKNGHISWQEPAALIEKKFRAYSPWPGVFTFWNNKRLLIDSLKIYSKDLPLTAGKVKKVDNNKIIVGCQPGAIQLNRLKLEGGNVMAPIDFIKGHPNFINSQLN